ncbi:MAG: hypothetical protein MUD01_22850 [Chloroflexaceae bacterium]|nr:hypothetical protein [Chloroflexaceae bacterium]
MLKRLRSLLALIILSLALAAGFAGAATMGAGASTNHGATFATVDNPETNPVNIDAW